MYVPFGQWETLLKTHTHYKKHRTKKRLLVSSKKNKESFFALLPLFYIRNDINMKILVYTNNISAGEWVKETLEEFGRGMHIIVRGEDNEDILKKPFSYVITLGNLDKEIPSE